MKKVLVKVSKLLLTLVMVFSMFTTYSFAASLGQDESTVVRIHYDKGDISNWDIWAWADGIDGNNYQFTGSDDFGYIAQFNLDKIVDQVNFIVRKNDWSYRELSDLDDGNRVVHVVNGVAEAYIKADDPNTYLYKPEKEDKNIESYVSTKDQNLEKLATSADDKSTKDQIETNKTITVHFDNPKNENWNLWLWPKNASGKEYEFSEKDDFGQYSDINVASKETEFGFLIKNPNWEKDYDKDRFIDLNKGDEVWIKSKDPNVYYENPDKPAFLYKKLSASVNLKTYNKDKKYKLKAWSDKDGETNAKKFDFVNEGNYLVAKVEFMSSTYFKLIELDETGNEIREEKSSRIIKNFDENGYTRLYIVENDPKIYKHESKIEDNKITRISIDDYNTISIKLAKPTNVEELISNGYNFETNSNLTKDNILSIEAKVPENKDSNELKVKFNKKLDIEKDYSFTFYLDKAMKYPMKATAVIGNVIATKDFDDKYYYDGKLGAIYSLDQTIFRIWAPSASAVDLIAYVNGKEVKLPMDRLKKGVYQLKLAGDNELLNYQYDVRFKDGTVNRVVDPYSRSTTKNGERSVVVNPKKSIVERPERQLVKNPIIYELHVRDLSNQDQSGIKNKGRFLGLTEKGTRTPSGQKTGIDYIKDLGVSHIQLLPIYDFSKNSVDENEPLAKFNWGYDPVNYNVPEGAYSTNPDDPYSRINEMQEMIDAVHKEGMGVIMDVVYNHVSSLDEHPFNKIVPGYYFRFDENGNPYDGTGVGNEIASERKMVRKYIVDSVMYLAETYKIDGFRFDLMGILDLDTMNELCERLHEINPDIVLLGEGWDMGNHPKEIRANQTNAYKMPNIATFNDDLRDGVKGSAFDGDALGFVNGENNEEKLFEQIKTKSNVNDYKFYDNPRQLIQYTEAHDNKTSWDKIKEIYPD